MTKSDEKAEFLLKEFEQFWLHYRHVEKERQLYFNIYIVLFVALTGISFSLPKIIQILFEQIINKNPDSALSNISNININLYFLILVMVFLIFYGTNLIYMEIKLRYENITYIWQINSIRKYFLERNNELIDYLQFEVADGPKIYDEKVPQVFKLKTGILSIKIIAFLNSTILTMLLVIILDLDVIKTVVLKFLSKYIDFKSIAAYIPQDKVFYLIVLVFLASLTILPLSYYIYMVIVKRNLKLKQKDFEEKLNNMNNNYNSVIKDYKIFKTK